MSDFEDGLLKVSATVNPQSLGSVIARAIQAGKADEIKLRAIGAGAVNQASKACAIARGFAATRGIDLTFIIGFEDVAGDEGKTISAVVWRPVVR